MMIVIKAVSQFGLVTMVVARPNLPGILNILEDSKLVKTFSVFSSDTECRLDQQQLGFGDFKKWIV